MIITIPWLKEHLKTKASETQITDKLTNIGLEVEGIKEKSDQLSSDCKSSSIVGKLLAKRAIKKGIKQVIFDRGGNIYHGRVKALAEAAREAGLNF